MEGEPYTVGKGAWRWFRGRMLGGRTHHWGRISLRFGPDDFRRKSLDGFGDDWPITYEDMKPYYDKADEFIGIFGTNHASQTGLHNEPDGIFLPPPKPRAHELLIKKACDRPEDSRWCPRASRSSPRRTTAAPRATTAGSAAAAARRTRTSRASR